MRGVATASEEFLAELGERFDRVQVACSFQKEAVVIAHLVSEHLPKATFFTLDTGLFFPETYETWDKLEARLGITVDGRRGITLDEQATATRSNRSPSSPRSCVVSSRRRTRPRRARPGTARSSTSR